LWATCRDFWAPIPPAPSLPDPRGQTADLDSARKLFIIFGLCWNFWIPDKNSYPDYALKPIQVFSLILTMQKNYSESNLLSRLCNKPIPCQTSYLDSAKNYSKLNLLLICYETPDLDSPKKWSRVKQLIWTFEMLKVHKIEIFFGFNFEICIISLLVMWKY